MTDKEKELTQNFISAMTTEELLVVVKCIPDSILWDELFVRFNDNRRKVGDIQNVLGGKINEKSKGAH